MRTNVKASCDFHRCILGSDVYDTVDSGGKGFCLLTTSF